MNRRTFLAGSAAVAALAPTFNVAALDVDFAENPILQAFRMLPDTPDADGFDFPITTGTNGPLQRSVWPENPAMYWDPEGEDYFTVLGIYPAWMQLRATQVEASLWLMNTEAYDRDASRQTLESNGWEVVDQDLHLLHYAGSEDDRAALAGSLNLLGIRMREGAWDWVALADDAALVMGSSEDRVRVIADHVQNNTAISSMDERVDQLRDVIRPDSYLISLLPPQRLSIESVEASFVSRSWTGDVPIIQSIGLKMKTGEQVQQMIDSVQERLKSETSNLLDTAYADFLEITDIATYRGSVRFDLVDSSGEWDVLRALNADDLKMLPQS